ncbi:hypothetical protein [Photobacterium sp. GB-3]|uniref:hypothetical protein n=1 Tax=Photobacterium sp. GB-3 TaxID=2022110 RepID=UPI000D150B86|nr:hypothetical protein [Photobacterium sp. GB-3]PSV56721.1 hypothetical protein C9J43_09770 [Photobacterium sp. GB-3]
MDASGLLTVFAVLLTGATLLPSKFLLDLRIRLTFKDKVVFILLIFFSFYFLFFDVLKYNKLILPLPWIWGFNEKSSLLATSILMIAFVLIKLKESNLPKSSIRKLTKEVDLLIKERNFQDISYLIDKYQIDLLNYYKTTPWYVKLKNFIIPNNTSLIIFSSDKEEQSKVTISNLFHGVRLKIGDKIPSNYVVSEDVESLIVSLFKSMGLTDYWAKNHPTLALTLLSNITKIESIYREEFITLLLSDPHSLLYRELTQTKYIAPSSCYEIDRSNSLLRYLFDDVKNCETLKIYSPIKSYIVKIIKKEKEKGEESIYNKPCNEFIDSNERYSCPVYMSIFIYDVMIREAIDQSSKSHLFPNYLYHISIELLNSINSLELNSSDSEFPTRNHYLLYECFSTMVTWIDMIGERKYDKLKYDPYLILESFGMMTYHLLESEKISDDKKAYFFSIVLRTLKSLEDSNLVSYANKIASHITRLYDFKMESEYHLEVINRLKPIIRNDDCLLLIVVRKFFPTNSNQNKYYSFQEEV